MALADIFNWIFAPIVNNFSKPVSIIIISFVLTALITFIYKKFTNQQELKDIKEEMGKLRENMKNHKDDAAKITEINKRMWELSSKQMKSSFRPTLITFIPLILLFGWMRTVFNTNEQLITWGFKIPLFGTGLGWLGTYIISSIVFSIVLRKIFKIY